MAVASASRTPIRLDQCIIRPFLLIVVADQVPLQGPQERTRRTPTEVTHPSLTLAQLGEATTTEPLLPPQAPMKSRHVHCYGDSFVSFSLLIRLLELDKLVTIDPGDNIQVSPLTSSATTHSLVFGIGFGLDNSKRNVMV